MVFLESGIAKYKNTLFYGAFFLILLGIIFLRVMGLGWGYDASSNHFYHCDESRTVLFLQDNNLDRAFTEGPIGYFLWKILIKLCCLSQGVTLVLLLRLLSGIFDVSTCLLVYFYAKHILGNKYYALFPMAWYGFMFGPILYSHYLRPHLIANFFLMVFLISLLRFKATWPGIISSAIAWAIMTATRYNMAFFIVFLVYEVFITEQNNKLRVRKIIIALVVAIAIFMTILVSLSTGGATIWAGFYYQKQCSNFVVINAASCFNSIKAIFREMPTYLRCVLPIATSYLFLLLLGLSLIADKMMQSRVRFYLGVLFLYVVFIAWVYPYPTIRMLLPVTLLLVILSMYGLKRIMGIHNKKGSALLIFSLVTFTGMAFVFSLGGVVALADSRQDPVYKLTTILEQNNLQQIGFYSSRFSWYFPQILSRNAYTKKEHPFNVCSYKQADLSAAPEQVLVLLRSPDDGKENEDVLLQKLQKTNLYAVRIIKNEKLPFDQFQRLPHDIVYPFPIFYLISRKKIQLLGLD